MFTAQYYLLFVTGWQTLSEFILLFIQFDVVEPVENR